MGTNRKEDFKGFGERLRSLRKARRLTLKQAGELINDATTTMVSKWENGTSFPRPVYLKKIAEVYKTSFDYMLTGEETTHKLPSAETDKDVMMLLGVLYQNDTVSLTSLTDNDGRTFAALYAHGLKYADFVQNLLNVYGEKGILWTDYHDLLDKISDKHCEEKDL